MAEAVVSALLEKLTSVALGEIDKAVRLIINVPEEVEKLKSSFRAIKAVLEDAEQQRVKKHEAGVRDWLDKLMQVSYDIENVLDEWSTFNSKPRKEELKVCSFIPSPSSCFNRLKLLYKTARKMQKLSTRLGDIAKERLDYRFKESSEEDLEKLEREEFVSDIQSADVCGRVEDKKSIVDLLLDEGGNEELGSAFHIISMVGTGGIGKTTLAQLVFNDEKVTSHFEDKIWVCVSDRFDEMRIAKKILKSVGYVDYEKLDEREDVLKGIKNSIEGKKFLLVLDDVWTDTIGLWDGLFKLSLSYGLLGSKILVTTRKETVARIMGCTKLFEVKKLSDEEGWSLFSQEAFLGRSAKDREGLEEIGRGISNKCDGSPLALKIVGCLMRLKSTMKEWRSVLQSEIWELEVADDLFKPLMFSYYDLPSHLRQCFSYCAIFPKDYEIEKNKLIELWMSQGFLKETEHKDMEMVGEENFNHLAMRSFFHDFARDENGEIIKCKMHDMVHDFTQFLTKGECLTMESCSSVEGLNPRARHMMFMLQTANPFPACIYNAENLHTLLIESEYCYSDYHVDLLKLFDKMRYLRALKCNYHPIENCPKLIGKLIHLRHVDLSKNMEVKELPEAMCDLYNLLILDISGCRKLKRLPSGMGNLINLWHLRNGETDDLSFMPKGMEKLSRLRTLSKFVVPADGKGAVLGDLEKLTHLQGLLEIRGLENVRDEAAAEKAQLQNKEELTGLCLNFDPTQTSSLILEALQPPSKLERFEINGYGSSTMWVWPSWMVLLTKLKNLVLSRCGNIEELPPLGTLPCLESLTLLHIKKVKKVGVEFLGIESATSFSPSSSSIVAFPNLKSLSFCGMEEWEEWDYGSRGGEGITIMPCLSSLEIDGCRKLKALPNQILQNNKLRKLRITDCPIISNRCKDYRPHIFRIADLYVEDFTMQKRKNFRRPYPYESKIF